MQPEVEREVVRMSKSGDPRSYEPLVRAYEGPGLRLAVGMLGSVDEARDALQDAFIKAWQSLHRFDITRPFGPWFFQILRNQCRDVIRSRQSRERHEVRDEQIDVLGDPIQPLHFPAFDGFDRFAMLLGGFDSLREVIAFPKTQRGQDLLMDAPTPVEKEQLEELHLRVRLPRREEPSGQ